MACRDLLYAAAQPQSTSTIPMEDELGTETNAKVAHSFSGGAGAKGILMRVVPSRHVLLAVVFLGGKMFWGAKNSGQTLGARVLNQT